jgi:alpha-mannosidase
MDRGNGNNNDLLVFNTLSWQRDTLVEIPSRKNSQSIRNGTQDQLLVQNYNGKSYAWIPRIPSLGWMTTDLDNAKTNDTSETAHFLENVIETNHYRIEINDDGNFARIYDKANDHEVLSAPGNLFQVFDDDPGHKFSAWDIAYHFEEYEYSVHQESAWQLAANGPLFAVFTSSWRVLDSTIEQEMWLYAENRRIDFHTKLVWQDSRKLLKVAFPLEIRTKTATYDLPFGHIERATHRNTTWEQAKFEVSGHKWADLSEGDYGVALLNDCKYGYDARENVLRLSLLRSPVRPDCGSDQGEHEFTYALLPHAGNWRHAQVDRKAYEFNIPAFAVMLPEGKFEDQSWIPKNLSFLKINSPSLVVETLKQAEDGDGIVLRTFDSHGCHKKVGFKTASNLDKIFDTDLLEESPMSIPPQNPNSFTIGYSPYEIKTHRLEFSPIFLIKNVDIRK